MQTGRGQQSFRGSKRSGSPQVRGRGRGRGGAPQATNHGASQRVTSAPFSQGTRGRGAPRGRGNATKVFGGPRSAFDSHTPQLAIDPPPESIQEYDFEQLSLRRTQLHEQYEKYRQDAINRGLMSDDNQSSLDEAIRTVGTCTQMCDEKERVNRIYEGQTDAAERLPAYESGASTAVEGRMVKKFRRSAAGVDKQIPQELRTPGTLQRTLDYLFDELIGKHRLGMHHKFIWDRTRAIRNDFSIQSLTNPEHVRYEIDCYERIVRFHILSAHQLSNPENLIDGEHFEHQQELEQLQKTFQSLMDKYDVFRSIVDLPNEAEFRAYYIVFSPILVKFDFEIEMQRWPETVLRDGRVQTALSLLAAMGSPDNAVGSTNVGRIPVAISQANISRFWSLVDSKRVGYLMACVAEISFQRVRYTALNAIWKSAKTAQKKSQGAMKHWTKPILAEYLAFDQLEDLEELCTRLGVEFSVENDQEYLNFQSRNEPYLDNPFSKPEQLFSHAVVETKRHGRTLVAVINDLSIARARQENMIEDEEEYPVETRKERSSMFVGDDDEAEDSPLQSPASSRNSTLNPAAPVFKAVTDTLPSADAQPTWMTSFGQRKASPADANRGLFGHLTLDPTEKKAESRSTSSNPFTTTPIQPQETETTKKAPFSGFQPDATKPPFAGFNFKGASSENVNNAALEASANGSTQSSPAQGAPQAPPTSLRDSSSDASKPFFNPSFPTSPTATTAQIEPSQPISSTSTPIFGFNLQPRSDPKPNTNSIFKFGESTSTSQPNQPSTSPSNLSDNTLVTQNPLDIGHSLLNQTSQQIPSNTSPSVLFTPASTEKPTVTSSSEQQSPTITSYSTDFSYTEKGKAREIDPATPEGSPIKNTIDLFSTASKADLSPRSTPATLPAFQPQPVPLVEDSFDEEEVLTHLCRLSLVQEEGTLDMFLSYKISRLVKETFEWFVLNKRDRRMQQLKRKHLKRKYFDKWHTVTVQRRLQRRAYSRRQRIAATMQKERKEARDLKEILEAEGFRKRMQEEQKKKQEEDEERKRQLQAAIQARETAQKGTKRKVLANGTASLSLQGIGMSPKHKRSRTLGSSEDLNQLRVSVRSPRPTVASLADPLNLRRSISQKNMRQSLTRQRLDQTKTDYFLLKAYGVDPQTPFIPETKDQVQARKQREADYQESVTARVYKRRKSTHSQSSGSPARDESPLLIERPISQDALQRTRTAPTSAPSLDDDPFLKSLEEARQALQSDKEWFTTQTVEIGKEIEQQEEFRRSRDSPSLDGSITPSVNGFAKSLNGKEYVPPVLKPGQTLSRTERRIQQTGARGLATAPIGGTPISSPHSAHSIPMSRHTASQLNNPLVQFAQVATYSAVSPKRTLDDVYTNGTDDDIHEQTGSVQQSKKVRHAIRLADTQDDYEREDEYASEEDLEDDQHFYTNNGEEHDDDEAEVDQDDYGIRLGGYMPEEEEVYDDEDEEGNLLPPRASRGVSTLSVATPDTGIGSTAAEAIELSD